MIMTKPLTFKPDCAKMTAEIKQRKINYADSDT